MATRRSLEVAGKGSARKKRKQTDLSPQQRRISHYFKPSAGNSQSSNDQSLQGRGVTSCTLTPPESQKQPDLAGPSVFVHDSEDSSQIGTTFSQLPGKIMENIFCRLPIVDLMLNCSLVCPAWREIISKDTVSLICFVT